MLTIEASHRDGSVEPIARRVRRRDQLEPLGLLLGFFGVLLVLVLTMGATPLP